MTVLKTAMEIYFKGNVHSTVSSCERDKGLWGTEEIFCSLPGILHLYKESDKTCTRLILQRYSRFQEPEFTFGFVVLIYKKKVIGYIVMG